MGGGASTVEHGRIVTVQPAALGNHGNQKPTHKAQPIQRQMSEPGGYLHGQGGKHHHGNHLKRKSLDNTKVHHQQAVTPHNNSKETMSQYASPPGIGFRPETLGYTATGMPENGGFSQQGYPTEYVASYDKDLTYMRVLSAEEFLMRMTETDAAIRHWSQCDERELHYTQVKELVGLRGHLQDELLRIVAMMSEGDPNLQALNDFEGAFVNTTSVLRDLHRKSQAIQIQSIDIGMGTDATETQTQTTGTTLPRIGQGHSIGTQASSQGQGQSMSTQSESQGHSIAIGEDDGEEVIETQLKPRFVAEENHLNDDFTRRIIQSGRQLTQADMDALLSDHAISMQALRKKQDLERGKYKELLEAKKRERLLKRRAANQGQRSQVQTSPQRQNPKGEFFFIDFKDFDNKKSTKSRPLPNRANSAQKSTWFSVDMDGNTTSETRKFGNSQTAKSGNTQITATMPAASTQTQKPVGIATAVQAGPHRNSQTSTGTGSSAALGALESASDEDENLETNYEDDFEEADSDNAEEKAELKTTLKDDLWSTLREQEGTSKEDFQELLGAYRDQEQGRKNIRESENLKHKSSFLSKLAARKKRGEDGSDTTSDTSSLSSYGAVEDDDLSAELQEIKNVDSELVKKLLAQRRNMTDADFQELLRRHLADVEKLRQQRVSDRNKLDARLQDKLNARKGQSSAESEELEKDEKLEKELTALDLKLQNELKRRGKNIDESDLEELLEHYRRQQEALLKKRNFDRAKNDDKLKRKLEEKQRQKQEYQAAESSNELKAEGADNSFFQEIQVLQSGGQLTESLFSKLLNAHLERNDKNKRQARQKQIAKDKKQDEEAAQNAASSLVQESQQQMKQIQGIRQREKDAMDQKLQRRLQAKKNKKVDST